MQANTMGRSGDRLSNVDRSGEPGQLTGSCDVFCEHDRIAVPQQHRRADHPTVALVSLPADPADVHLDMLNGGYPTLPVLDREMKVVNPDNFPFNAEFLATLAADTAEE